MFVGVHTGAMMLPMQVSIFNQIYMNICDIYVREKECVRAGEGFCVKVLLTPSGSGKGISSYL